MERSPTTQDVSWLLDLEKNGQLDLDPPYQRHSVWTMRDRRFFLDTIFRNFPSPAIFLHKQISETGATKYYVVDGKQRIETILRFAKNKLRIASDYGDNRLDNKRFTDLIDAELKKKFWNYKLPVEMIGFTEDELVKDVFERLNRNSRKLTRQELRHAKFDGWLITWAENEADNELWSSLGIVSKARTKRMVDAQFISELMAVVIRNEYTGFSQEYLDELYADYDELADMEDFNVDVFQARFAATRTTVVDMEAQNNCVTLHARGFGAFYSLWAVLALVPGLPTAPVLAERYAEFMAKVDELEALPPGDAVPAGYEPAARYRENARGASTEHSQRAERHAVLAAVLGRA